MRYEDINRHSSKARIYALKTLNAMEAKKERAESELAKITYDSVSRSVKSLSGFFKAYSILLILIIAAIIVSFV